MKQLLVFVALMPFSSLAQNSILYEISKKGVSQKSYLFGTMHVQNEAAFSFNDSVYWAINQCNQTAFELNLDPKEIKTAFGKESIESLIDSAFVDKITSYLAADFVPVLMNKLPAKDLAKKITDELLPAYFEYIKSMSDGQKRGYFVDQYLQNFARKQGKEVLGIETYMEQLMAILGDVKNYRFDDKTLSPKIVDFIADNELKLNLGKYIGGTTSMVNLYSKADLAGLCDYVHNQTSSNLAVINFYERLFTERNEIMYQRTKDLVASDKVFIAVGAGHLCGSNGLLKQFENDGYTSRPVNVFKKTNNKLIWNTIKTAQYTVDIPVGAILLDAPLSPMSFALDEANAYSGTIFLPQGSANFSIQMEMEDDDEYSEVAAPYEMQEYEEESDETSIEENSEIVNDISEVETTEDGELQEKYNEEKTEESSLDKNKIKNKFDSVQQAYFKEVGDSVTSHLKGKMMEIMSPMMGFLVQKSDTSKIVIKKQKLDMVINTSPILGTQKKVLVSHKTNSYTLVISGDEALMRSKELDRFFTSFRAKN